MDSYVEIDARATRTTSREYALWITIAGNLLEWFDWTIYATFAPYIAKTMFAPSDEISAMLQTLAVFAVGFVARPIGGLMFGKFADTHGRRGALVTSMLLMATGSLLIAVAPSFAQVGVMASALLLVARLVQGFAHGGESGASYVYIAELAPARSRGLWCSSAFASVTGGVVLGSLLGVVLTQTLDSALLQSWGWRIPFVVGGGLAIFTFYLRRSAIESEAFQDNKREALVSPERARSSRSAGVTRLRLFILISATVVVYYTWLGFATSYAVVNKGISEKLAFSASLAAQLICLLAMPFFGWLSDLVGRKPLALFTTIGFTLLSFPLDFLFQSSAWSLFICQTIALLMFAATGAIYPALLSEQLATSHRGASIGLVSSLSAAIFGGTGPYLNTWLTSIGAHWLFTSYTVILCILATIAVATMPETKGIDLRVAGTETD
ncbi:MFS transporter [Cupriavidus lacunae]|uniref:MFS transporter n=1 Tax=Cupriavidus lacunae TaxID=2666307 RepID=UPI001ABF9271|nr:MFS transporter [Cupriavidus lacunae]